MIVTTVHQIYTIFYSGHPDHSDTGQQAGDSQGQGTKAQGQWFIAWRWERISRIDQGEELSR